MKKTVILLASLWLGQGCFLFSQKYYKQQFTLFKYNCVLDSRINQFFSPFEGYIDCNAPKGYTKTEAMFVASVFQAVKSKLENKFTVYVLPVNSYGDKASYDAFGYPDLMINQAIKKGTTKYFFKVTALIQVSSQTKQDNEIIPVVKVQIDIYNKNGYQPVSSAQGTSEAAGSMKQHPSMLTGMECITLPEDRRAPSGTEVMMTLINDAIDEALKKL